MGKYNLAAFARAAGFRKVHELKSLIDFRKQVGGILSGPGPTFVSLRVDKGPSGPFPSINWAETARRLEKALQ